VSVELRAQDDPFRIIGGDLICVGVASFEADAVDQTVIATIPGFEL